MPIKLQINCSKIETKQSVNRKKIERKNITILGPPAPGLVVTISHIKKTQLILSPQIGVLVNFNLDSFGRLSSLSISIISIESKIYKTKKLE